jgi:hypothetical protein
MSDCGQSKEKYQKSYNYDRANNKIDLWSGLLNLAFILTILLLGGFGYLDNYVKSITSNL